jgi:hypothetical protein
MTRTAETQPATANLEIVERPVLPVIVVSPYPTDLQVEARTLARRDRRIPSRGPRRRLHDGWFHCSRVRLTPHPRFGHSVEHHDCILSTKSAPTTTDLLSAAKCRAPLTVQPGDSCLPWRACVSPTPRNPVSRHTAASRFVCKPAQATSTRCARSLLPLRLELSDDVLGREVQVDLRGPQVVVP